MLLFRPGALTRRYVAGERARFVSPLALFLFLVFVMFAMIHVLAGEFEPDMPAAIQEQAIHQIDKEIAEHRDRTTAAKTARERTTYHETTQDMKVARAARQQEGGEGIPS